MFRKMLLGALVLAPAAFLAARTASAGGAGCGNVLPREALVVYDVTGFSFIGALIHQHLVVYNDGTAAISQASESFGGSTEGAGSGDSKVVFVTPEKAKRFLRELANAGAFTLCDQQLAANDIPLTTLTVLTDATDASAHTFSYWVGMDAYGNVQQIVDAFIASTFPGF